MGAWNVQPDELIRLIDRFHRAFPADPPGAFRDFLRVEERLRRDGDETAARALADALWVLAPEIPFVSDVARAAFFHAFAHFLASPGPAFDEERAREAMEVPRMIDSSILRGDGAKDPRLRRRS
jgi:hypothetical protein